MDDMDVVCLWLDSHEFESAQNAQSGQPLCDIFPDGLGVIGTKGFRKVVHVWNCTRQDFEKVMVYLEGE